MLNETEAIATIAVKDLGRAAAFHADRLLAQGSGRQRAERGGSLAQRTPKMPMRPIAIR